jgi:hypothetical protein
MKMGFLRVAQVRVASRLMVNVETGSKKNL